jgi:hypothetical protein
MPLIKRKSDKAFEHNMKAEMRAGKPQKQSLAIAYSVKRRAKKMAEGGAAFDFKHRKNNETGINRAHGNPDGGMSGRGGYVRDIQQQKSRYSGQSDPEARENIISDHKLVMGELKKTKPKLQGLYDGGLVDTNSKASISRNSGNKPAHDDSWTDKPTERQATANDVRGKKLPIKRPKMVPTDAFSTRLYDAEGALEDSANPGPYDAQPPRHDDEESPDRQGPKVPDMAHEHSNGRMPYASGGSVHDEYNNPSRDDEPSMDEGASMAMHRNEAMADAEGKSPDMEREHSNGRKPYARGGEISPMHEEEEEHHSSITAAIMARRQRLHAEIDSGAHDLDEAVRMAEGGEILSHDSIYSDDSDQADLSRNHDEDANEEDQLSFNALRRENYNTSNLDVENPKDSGQRGDDEEMDSHDKNDMVGSIRRKMRTKRQFSQD